MHLAAISKVIAEDSAADFAERTPLLAVEMNNSALDVAAALAAASLAATAAASAAAFSAARLHRLQLSPQQK